jgi:hypothetical protein
LEDKAITPAIDKAREVEERPKVIGQEMAK